MRKCLKRNFITLGRKRTDQTAAHWKIIEDLFDCQPCVYPQKRDGLNQQGLTVIVPHFFTVDSLWWNTPLLGFRRDIDKLETERFCAYSFGHSSHILEHLFTWCHQAKSAGSSRLASNVPPLWGLPCHLQTKSTSIKGVTIG